MDLEADNGTSVRGRMFNLKILVLGLPEETEYGAAMHEQSVGLSATGRLPPDAPLSSTGGLSPASTAGRLSASTAGRLFGATAGPLPASFAPSLRLPTGAL